MSETVTAGILQPGPYRWLVEVQDGDANNPSLGNNTRTRSQYLTMNLGGGGGQPTKDGIACDFGVTYGLWHWDQTGGWVRWNAADPGQLLAVDIDNDGTDELIATFVGYGLYTYDPADGWIRINTTLPDAMIHLGNGVACDFGTAYGLWYWTKTGGWIRWNASDPDKLLAVDINNDGTDELIASFTGYGLYTYNPATQAWVRINTTLPDAGLGINLIN
jgi:hypothetical protein